MKDWLNEIDHRFPVRNSDAQKEAFRSYVLEHGEENVQAGGKVTYNGAQVLTNAEVELLCTDLPGGETRVIFSRRVPALRAGAAREFTFAAVPEKLEKGNLAVRFSSSQGGFTAGGNKDDNGGSGGGGSGGCNALWNAGFGGLTLAVISLLYSKKGRKQG